ncbi:MAG: DAK2 domain-containing protein [Boseongicola sp. SB0664_bin_43]|uniref:DAK2 domain-containing protein n=1 Tax=Boseongicola sp. SB0664_bin_43 TaxID=2604844 RepID=A0A6B0Y3I8_9RHOB|nr:DAK2 domain-containing protein [Boseongicola sp. SB0664_bin_43]
MSAEGFFRSLHEAASTRVQELNALDAAVGDGDHGTTLVRGLAHAATVGPGRRAKAFMRASGGASGTLFGLVLHEIERHLDGGSDLAEGLERACARICDLGEVRPGDKSLVDSLAPAIGALADGRSLGVAVSAAEAGRDATRDMRARCGRTQHVEGGGAGHLDPGAVSLVLILEALARESVS